jgi:hypothetical protein
MKSRFSILAIAVFAFSVAAFGQRPLDNTGTGATIFGTNIGGDITSRSYTNAALTDGTGNVIGKVKTATVVSASRGTVEGLRVQVHNLTAGAAYAIVIDGTLVGQATADASGTVTFKFLSPSNGRTPSIPDAIRPISSARTVQLYEAAGQRLIASGTFTGRTK